jgi:hypothetical protein
MAVQLSSNSYGSFYLSQKQIHFGRNLYNNCCSYFKSYSSHTFDYPYPKAVSVSAEDQGMEYPMICWNFGRPDAKGVTSEQTKNGMMGVVIHEVITSFL